MNTQLPSDQVFDIEILLMQQAWLGRLASALVGEPAAAEDLIQSTWLTALSSPPRARDAARGWLRRVFVSRLRDSVRQRNRREAREQLGATTDQVSTRVETPEELLARMELHRSLAGHMASLDQRIRVVLYLCFVEDLEPIEVARRLGIPGGTVRWRLKRGIEELRLRLDADAGGKREAWLAPLLPLASNSEPQRVATLALRKPVTSWAARVALSGVLLSAGLPAVCVQCGRHESKQSLQTAEQLYKSGALARAAKQAVVPVLPTNSTAGLALSVPPSSCPEVEVLEKERDELIATLEHFKEPREHFQDSPPNLGVEQRFGAVVDEMLTRAGKCGHALECRGVVCRVTLVVPESVRTDERLGIEVCFDPALSNQVKTKLVGQQIEGRGTAFDLISHSWLNRFEIYFVLANEELEPATPEQTEPHQLPFGWDRERGVVSLDLAPACRESVGQLLADIDQLVRRIRRALPSRLAFEQGVPNPELAQELAQRLKPHLATGDKALPIEIECRGRICALSPRALEPEAQVHWICPNDTKALGLCFANPAGDWWFSRLMRKRHELTLLERIEPPTKRHEHERPALVRIRPPQEQSGISGKKWVVELARHHDFSQVVAECEKRHPAQGVLTISVEVPEHCSAQEQRTGPPISVEYGGELIGSALWSCMKSATEQLLPRIQIPDCIYHWGGEWRLEFPHPRIDLSGVRD